MRVKTAFPWVLPLLLAGCLWHPLGGDARPRIGLEAVERSPAAGAPVTVSRPVVEPGARGYLFVDSLIAFRTRTNAAVVRFRLWNHGGTPITLLRDGAGLDARPGECPSAGGLLELRRRERREPETVVAPGASHEDEAVPAARVSGTDGEAWRSVGLPCFVFDPVGERVALRLAVEAGGARYLYTFWYRLLEAPREDGSAPGNLR